VFEGGYPAWKTAYGAAPAAVQVKAGTEEGSIDIATFKKIMQETPNSIYLVDVRDPDEYAMGHFKTAVNIPVDQYMWIRREAEKNGTNMSAVIKMLVRKAIEDAER